MRPLTAHSIHCHYSFSTLPKANTSILNRSSRIQHTHTHLHTHHHHPINAHCWLLNQFRPGWVTMWWRGSPCQSLCKIIKPCIFSKYPSHWWCASNWKTYNNDIVPDMQFSIADPRGERTRIYTHNWCLSHQVQGNIAGINISQHWTANIFKYFLQKTAF